MQLPDNYFVIKDVLDMEGNSKQGEKFDRRRGSIVSIYSSNNAEKEIQKGEPLVLCYQNREGYLKTSGFDSLTFDGDLLKIKTRNSEYILEEADEQDLDF